MKQTLKSRLIRWFEKRPTEWVHKQKICDIAHQATGAMSESVARRLRELCESGFLKVDDRRGSALYRVKQAEFDPIKWFDEYVPDDKITA